MPTVATKNGGPVDIMATLHHGLLVDPTNSKQIADALIKILTNAEVWDEMSHNGEPPSAAGQRGGVRSDSQLRVMNTPESMSQ